MATGPDSSQEWTTTTSISAVTPSRPLDSPPRFRNPSWGNARTLPPLRRFSEAQIDESWHHNPPQSSFPISLPPLDTRQERRSREQTEQLFVDHQFPNKRRRIESFPREAQTSDSPPKPTAESPSLHAGHGQPATAVPFSRHLSQQPDSQEGVPLSITRQDFASEAHADSSARDADCCQPGCGGSNCRKLRGTLQDLISEITRDPLAPAVPSIGYQPPKPVLNLPNIAHSLLALLQISHDSLEIGSPEALEWALQRLRWNNISLRNLVSVQTGASSESPPLFRRTPPFGSPPAGMKRQHDGNEKGADATSRNPSRSLQRSGGPSSLSGSLPDDNWRNLEAMDPPNHPSHHRRLSSFSGPSYESPTQASQAARTLPSPSSLNLHIPSNLPPVPPQLQSSAQSAHFQDLQHQVSVKTLALQTLQKEYDALLQKLERQKIRSQTLEKKFEVSDAEINSLADEKEKLTAQVQTLETQVEDLQQSRDEARRMGTESASQYMKIVEMADRLQGKGVEDKKSWEKERHSLLTRIRDLENERANTVKETLSASSTQVSTSDVGDGFITIETTHTSTNIDQSISGDEATRMGRDVRNLRERVKTLENSLQIVRNESRAIREAAITLASCGQRIDSAANAVLGKQDESQF